jgi:hypothetical protein
LCCLSFSFGHCVVCPLRSAIVLSVFYVWPLCCQKDKKTNNDLQNTTQKTKIEEHEYEPHEMPVVNAAAKRVKYTYNLRIKSEMVYYRYKLPPWRIRFY